MSSPDVIINIKNYVSVLLLKCVQESRASVVAKFAIIKFDSKYQGGQTCILYRPVYGDNGIRIFSNGKYEVITVNEQSLVCGSDNFALSATTYGHDQIRLYYIDDKSKVRELVGRKDTSAKSWKWTEGEFDKLGSKAEGGSHVSASCDADDTLTVVFVAAGQTSGFTKAYITSSSGWKSEVMG
ncbi:hypothetical protein F4678DRAFT_457077 [Xylaria arbuscula]|nr:hypothetical protein F4678DRAFT_457077 [Xylaria arbuscula]